MAMSAEDRDWLTTRFDAIEGGLHAHVVSDERRLTVLEVWRDGEIASSVKRGTWAGIVAAAGLTGLLEVAKVYMGRH